VDRDSRGGRGREARQQGCNVGVALLTDKVTELLVDEGKEHAFRGRWKNRKGAGCSAKSRDDGVVTLILFVKDLALNGASFFWRWGGGGSVGRHEHDVESSDDVALVVTLLLAGENGASRVHGRARRTGDESKDEQGEEEKSPLRLPDGEGAGRGHIDGLL
jgi:hypothetical protein